MQQHPGKRAQPAMQGFTLLETLLATAIIILILAAVYAVWHTAMRVQEGQTQRTQGSLAAAEAMTLITHDLSCAIRSPNSVDPALLLLCPEPATKEAPTTSKVTFFTTTPPRQTEGAAYFTLEKKTYEVLQNGDIPALYCIHQPAIGPGLHEPPRTNLVLDHVTDFTIQVFDGQQWLPAWPPNESGDLLPQAARVALGIYAKDQTTALESETLIASGNIVTTRLIRTQTATP